MRTSSCVLLLSFAAIALLGCAEGHRAVTGCATSADCPTGRCVDGVCVLADRDAGPMAMLDGGSADDEGVTVPDAGPPPPMCATSVECDDSDMCTTDACMGGSCASTPTTCDDGDACTDDTCDPMTGCGSTPTTCDDTNVCTTDACDMTTGCSFTSIAVPRGACALPVDVSAGGTFTGDSTCASSSFSGVCLGSGAPDTAFVLTLATESDVTLDARATGFSAVLFVGGTCGSSATACDLDGMPIIAARLPAGSHYIGLDGRAASDVGTYILAVTMTPVVRDELLTFPAATDTHFRTIGTNYWNVGDYVQGARTTGLASITAADLTLQISNALTCDNQDMQLRINGTLVGPVIITPGSATFTRSFTFGAIAGPNYTVRLETTSTVAGGCGSAGLPDGVSTLRVRR